MMASKESMLGPQPELPDCFLYYNPLDGLRSVAAEELAKIAGVDKAQVFPGLAFTNTLEKGDLTFPVPRLRIKGARPDELAARWASEVCTRWAQDMT